MLSTDAKLKKRMFDDFGEAGPEFIDIKKRQAGIERLDDLPLHVQHEFIMGITKDLYGDVISPDRINAKIFSILSDVYGMYDSIPTMMEHEHFKGIPPIGFLIFFFGKEVGEGLIRIEEKKRKIKDIHLLEDAEQFSILSEMIENLFRGNSFFLDQVSSNMIRYVLNGTEGNTVTFKQLVRKNGFSQNDMLIPIREYVLREANDATAEEKQFIVEVAGIARDTNVEERFINEGAGKRIILGTIEKEIVNKIGKFISPTECIRIIKEAKEYSGIITFEDASSIRKMMFVNYILNNTSIESASDQRERLVRNQLQRVLGI
jgi:hypothetical protein